MAEVLQEKELVELVKKVAEETLEVDLSGATQGTPLRELGMDSSDLLELVSLLEDRLEVCVPDSKFKDLETVGSLITVLKGLQPVRGGGIPADAGGEERLTDVG